MFESATLYIEKAGNVECIYGEKCLQSGSRCDIIKLLEKQLRVHFPLDFTFLTNTAIKDISDLPIYPLHFFYVGVDGCGNNSSVYQFSRRVGDQVCCDTNVNVNHPKAEEISDTILAVVEPLKEKEYVVKKAFIPTRA